MFQDKLNNMKNFCEERIMSIHQEIMEESFSKQVQPKEYFPGNPELNAGANMLIEIAKHKEAEKEYSMVTTASSRSQDNFSPEDMYKAMLISQKFIREKERQEEIAFAEMMCRIRDYRKGPSEEMDKIIEIHE
jgi:hypothetical protein